jgi:catalase
LARTDEVVHALPFNANKPDEYDRDAALSPAEGQNVPLPADVSASTLTEGNANQKTGGPAEPGENPSQDHVTVVEAFVRAIGRHRNFERQAATMPD